MPAENKEISVGELFAGVGGFRLALEGYSDPSNPLLTMPSAGNYKFSWANQWEPPGSEKKQFAWRCYEQRFGEGSCENDDIQNVASRIKDDNSIFPDVDLIVAGFPCQDYSVAKPLRLTKGIEGEKGRLWWTLFEILKLKKPQYILLENVDRLVRGKVAGCGRDFATILSSLNKLKYSVEWRIINAADYGYPQKRRRVYIFGMLEAEKWNLENRILSSGILAESFPVKAKPDTQESILIPKNPKTVARQFGKTLKSSPFQNAGAMQNGKALTMKVDACSVGEQKVLGDVLVPCTEVPESFYIPEDKLPIWKAYRDPKKKEKVNRNGIKYTYCEGGMAWPDPIDRPSRTILTGEGGRGASRMKHAIKDETGRIRRLVPDELDQLQGFPRGWTDTGMTDNQRAFCMGNALIVQIPHEIGKTLAKRHSASDV